MKSRFYDYANLIIDNIEGGYYSPERHYNDAMGKSGETMFGMDRKWGGAVVNDSEPGKKFWALVDANSSSWPYNGKGGSAEKDLRKLAAEIMWLSYEKYSESYLSEQARKIIGKSPKLETHFYYACWNGPVHFKNFADTINSAIQSGSKSREQLEKIAIESRLNHSIALLRAGGAKMRDKIFPELPSSTTSSAWIWALVGIVVVGGGTFAAYKSGLFTSKR